MVGPAFSTRLVHLISVHADVRSEEDAPAMTEALGESKKSPAGAIFVLVIFPLALLAGVCGPFGRFIDPTDRGDQLLKVHVKDESAARPDRAEEYSIRAYREWFGWGRTCVGVFKWRTDGGRHGGVSRWRVTGGTVCDAGGDPDDSGWRAGDVIARIGNSWEYAAIGVVPERAAKVRVTRVADGASEEVTTRRLEGRDGRFFALWRSGFLRDEHSLLQYEDPPEVRVTLLDKNGRPLSR